MHRRRRLSLTLVAAGLCLAGTRPSLRVSPLPLVSPVTALHAQEQAPNRREVTIAIRDFRFTPDRVEVMQDDIVRITVRSEDIAHTFNIDEYRIAKRIPPGSTTTFEFRADRPGTFPYYCNLSEGGHGQTRGQLVVRPRT